jgi:hypothetical protein
VRTSWLLARPRVRVEPIEVNGMKLRILWLFVLLVAASAADAQDAVSGISVALPDGKSVVLSGKQLAALPRVSESATAHGKTSRFEGRDLREALRAAGVTPLESLRGPLLKRVVTVVAADGYRVVFALSELDPTIGAKRVLLVDRENGAPLPAGDGPWRIVVPSDQRPARWARQVTGVVVSDLP